MPQPPDAPAHHHHWVQAPTWVAHRAIQRRGGEHAQGCLIGRREEHERFGS
jgi:hypothetical protein